MEYKIGDKVICVAQNLGITNGKIYVIIDMDDEYFEVFTDGGIKQTYFRHRFKKYEPKIIKPFGIVNFTRRYYDKV